MSEERGKDGAGGLRTLRGVVWLAMGRGSGIEAFGNTPQAYLRSLVPLLALPFAFALYDLVQGEASSAVTIVLLTLVGHLAPAVLSFELLRWWGRDAGWCRYAAAWNWCQWALPVVTVLVWVPLMTMQLPPGPWPEVVTPMMVRTAVLVYGVYALMLNLLVARHGLGLRWWRALALVLLVGAGTVALVVGPELFQEALESKGSGA